MQYKSNKGFTGIQQLGILMMLLGAGVVLGFIAQLAIGMQMLPKNTDLNSFGVAFIKASKKPENVNIMRWLQFANTFILFFLPSIFYSIVCNGKSFLWLGFSKHFNGFQIIIGFLIMFSANILAEPLAEFSKSVVGNLPRLNALALNLENTYSEQIMIFSRMNGLNDFFMSLFIMAFLPALFEEIFFRSVLQNLLVNWWKKPIIAIIFTSLLFSLVHGSVYLFLSRVLLGFALGFIYYKSKNIWINILAHFFNNGIIITTMFIFSLQNKKFDADSVELKTNWWAFFLAGGLLYFLFRIFNRYSEKNIISILTKQKLIESHKNM